MLAGPDCVGMIEEFDIVHWLPVESLVTIKRGGDWLDNRTTIRHNHEKQQAYI